MFVFVWGGRDLRPEEVKLDQSILTQRKEHDLYPKLTYLGEALSRIRIYREWSLGRDSHCVCRRSPISPTISCKKTEKLSLGVTQVPR